MYMLNMVKLTLQPLGPILEHGTNIMFERGVFDHLTAKWLGSDKGCRPLIEHSGMVLGLNHMSLVFVIFGVLLALSLAMFVGEVYAKRLQCIDFKIKPASQQDASHVEIDISDDETENEKVKAKEKEELGLFFDEFFKSYVNKSATPE